MHALVHGDQFERDMALIMVHGHHQVEFAVVHAVEYRVRGIGACAVYTAIPCFHRSRGDFLDFFTAERAALARMGVQPRNGKAGLLKSQPAQGVVTRTDGAKHKVFLYRGDRVTHGKVRCNVNNAQAFVKEAHVTMVHPGYGLEHGRVPGMFAARQEQALFADGTGHQALEAAFQREFRGGFYPGRGTA